MTAADITIDGRIRRKDRGNFDARYILAELEKWLDERELQFSDSCYVSTWDEFQSRERHMKCDKCGHKMGDHGPKGQCPVA